ncbi:glycosyltransferase family 4 protein [bacterium]|nr:glycosyltransferase family 4 protein [bacterium]
MDQIVKVLILTQYYPPEMGAPQARLHELAVRLSQAGHEITVLTAMPNYPTGKIFRGYRGRVFKTEMVDGIKVHRVPVFPTKSASPVLRLLCYSSFAAASFIAGILVARRSQLILTESPPLFLAPTGVFLKYIKRAKLVFNVSDIWPDILVRMGVGSNGFLIKCLEALESFAYRNSNVVALTNPGAMHQINDRFPEVATTVISNGVDTKMFSPAKSSTHARMKHSVSKDQFLVIYCGLHGLAQGLETVLGAAKILESDPRIRILFVGDGPVKEKLVSRAEDEALKNVLFSDRIPKSEIAELVASADLSLVPLACELPGTMPSKVYEALASGTPPIVTKGCEAEHLVNCHNSGRTFEPGDPESLARVILELIRDPVELRRVRDNAIQLSRRFDRDKIAGETEQIIRAIAFDGDLPNVIW